MSDSKFQQPLYKVFEPSFHTQTPIIVDESVESPETLTLRYEEEAARANGDLRDQSPTGILPMAAYKTKPAQLHGFPETTYPSYTPQTFSSQQPDNAAPQLTNLAFGSSQQTGQYMTLGSSPPQHVNIISCSPTVGTAGTRVELKVTSHYDLMAITAPAPYVWLSFGTQKCHTDVVKETVSQDGLIYIVSAAAPQFMATNSPSPSSVPLTLVIENHSGEDIARVPVVQPFAYQDVPGGPPTSSTNGTADDASAPAVSGDVTRRPSPLSPGQAGSPPQLTTCASTSSSPSHVGNQLPADAGTNNFPYPQASVNPATDPAAVAAVAQQSQDVQTSYAAATANPYSQDNDSMLGAYRSASFSDGFPRAAPPPLRAPSASPSWNAYSSLGHQQSHHHPHDRYGGIGRSHSIAHAHSTSSMTRPPLSAPLPAPSHGSAPQLIRTSTIQINSPNPMNSISGNGYGSSQWGGYPTKAVLSIMGNLDTMAQDWTPEEWNNGRRIVLFRKKQNGSHLETTFRPVPVNERPPNSICISCIYWAEKQECFVTSVDTINLLEQLVAAPARFSVEEKNRIRRNLEGFKPFTVSKAKAESENFFKLIMAFGAPKPRTIEKDVKVFPWKILGQALKKIISKYSASPSSILQPSSSPQGSMAASHHMMAPISLGQYQGLPPTPGSVATTSDTVSYVTVASGHNPSDSLASPRSLSGASWMTYAGGASGRAMSPGSTVAKPVSPTGSGLRMGSLSAAYDSRNGTHPSAAPAAHSYNHQHRQPHSFGSVLPVSSSTTATTGTSTAPTATSSLSHGGPTLSRWDTYDGAAGTGASYTNGHHHQGHPGQLYNTGYGPSPQRA